MNLHDRILCLGWLTEPESRAEMIDVARDVEILEQQVRMLERERDASPWRTGTPPESGRYLVTSGERWWVDSWGLVGQRWTNSRDSAVLAWMPVPKWEGR